MSALDYHVRQSRRTLCNYMTNRRRCFCAMSIWSAWPADENRTGSRQHRARRGRRADDPLPPQPPDRRAVPADARASPFAGRGDDGRRLGSRGKLTHHAWEEYGDRQMAVAASPPTRPRRCLPLSVAGPVNYAEPTCRGPAPCGPTLATVFTGLSRGHRLRGRGAVGMRCSSVGAARQAQRPCSTGKTSAAGER